MLILSSETLPVTVRYLCMLSVRKMLEYILAEESVVKV